MAAAVTPAHSKVCTEGCSHGGCNAVRSSSPADACCAPSQWVTPPRSSAGCRTSWQVLGHRDCVLADLDRWDQIEQEMNPR
jgi:hypothetical protein